MTKIPLRAYNREIESQIDRGLIDEAIAHCRHLLSLYPKHVDTYRLLGKAFLESQRYGDAADILQRVLSSIPDDFVSHVGMSIIREDEGNLDEAIWHMERAFEVQPSNSAIQDELRRLYGRRDGFEPPKIRLTRGALARMYFKGELYQQAVAELRAGLVEDPSRLDLQVLLAQAYARSGQLAEAAETCGSLLRKLPFCMAANAIMADVLTRTERKEETQAFKQRLQSLDPYYAHTTPDSPAPESAPEQAVTVERLAYKLTDGDRQPEWAASLGLGFDQDEPGEQAPDWLSAGASAADASPAASQPWEASAAGEAEQGADIPEWIKAAGWGPSTGAFVEGPVDFEGEEKPSPERGVPQGSSDDESASQSDIPDWLKAMAPEEELPAEESGSAEPPDLPWMAETPGKEQADWFWEQETAASAAQPTLSEQTGAEPGELPGWLAAEGGSGAAGTGTTGAQSWPVSEPPVSEPPVSGQDVRPGNEEIPDWLKGFVPDGEAQTAAQADAAGRAEAFESPEPAVPGWLSGAEEEPAVSEGQAAPAEELPGWLQEQGEEPATAGEELPDWLAEGEASEAAQAEGLPGGAQVFAGAGVSLTGDEEQPDAGLPDWLAEVQPESSAEEAGGELPDWLSEGAGEQPEAEAAAGAGAEAGAELPDWLREAAGEQPAAGAPAGAEWFSSEGLEPGAGAESFPQVAAQPEDLEETPAEAGTSGDWLEEYRMEKAAGQAQAETGDSEVPDWLLDMESEAQAEPHEELGDTRPSRVRNLTSIPVPAVEFESAGPEPLDLETGEPEAEGEAAGAEVYPAELPDWLKAGRDEQAGAEGLETPGEEPGELEPLAAEAETGAPPDWMFAGEAESATPEQSEVSELPEAGSELPAIEDQAAEEEELPDWLREQDVPSAQVFPAPEVEAAEAAPLEEQPIEPERGEAAPAEGAAETQYAQEDIDAAFAWLESLAAKQGAEEALLLKPEERVDTPPEWVQAAAQQEAAAQPVPTEQEPAPEQEPAAGQEPSAEAEAPAGVEAGLAGVFPAPETTGLEAAPEFAGSQAEDRAAEIGIETGERPVGGETTAGPSQGAEAFPTEMSQEDIDSALAWMESLAAKQGADEALFFNPEERSETPPDWVSAEISQAAPVEEELIPQAGEPSLDETAGLEAETLPGDELEEEPQTVKPDWLIEMELEAEREEALLAGEAEGVSPVEADYAEAPVGEEPPVEQAAPAGAPEAAAETAGGEEMQQELEPEAEAVVPAVEADAATEQDWFEEFLTQPAAPDQPAAEQPDDEGQPAGEPLEAETPAAEASAVQAPEPEALAGETGRSMPAWLKEMVEPGEAAAEEVEPAAAEWFEEPALAEPSQIAAPEPEMEAAPEAAPQDEVPPLPEWLAEAEEPAAGEESPGWTPPAQAEAKRQTELNQASLGELERLPGVGFVLAQEILRYREQHGPFEKVDDLLQVPGFSPSLLGFIRDQAFVVPPLPAAEPAPAPEAAPALFADAPAEGSVEVLPAREALSSGDLSTALERYTALIKSRSQLSTVIADLKTGLQQFPEEPLLWQALGDAYLRIDRPQEAIEAYNKAEEYLR